MRTHSEAFQFEKELEWENPAPGIRRQMMGYDDLMNSYRFVTTNAARTLHLGERYGIRQGNPASFVVMDAPNYYEALKNNAPVLYSYREGRLLARTPAGKTEVSF